MEKGQGDVGGGQPSAPPPMMEGQAQPPPPYFEGFNGGGAVPQFPTTFNAFDGPVPPTFGFSIDPTHPTPAMPMPQLPSDPPPTYSESNLTVDCPTSEEQVKEAILKHYADDCCFSPKSVDELTICEITEMHAFRFVLQTFLETRTITEESEPFRNQVIDGNQNGPVPDKWMVPVHPPQQFIAKAKISMPLPHSASVMACHKCHSTGYTACSSCGGMGFSRCTWCSGSGQRTRAGSTTELERCTSCSGMGRNNCSWCQLGRVKCKTCQGHRFLKVWQCLTVKWVTDEKVHETERGELKPKHLKKARIGEILSSKETSPMDPQPLKCSLDPNIAQVSQGMIGEMLRKQGVGCRVLQFRQKIGVIPVVKVVYLHKNKEGHFYVYGNTRLVYFPGGYIGRTGCCCAIV